MPRSKPHKKVSLTNVKKKNRTHKDKFIEDIQKAVLEYKNIYVFSYENIRNSMMNDVRLYWRNKGWFSFVKNNVVSRAIGRTSAEEISENLHLVSQKLVGKRALFFTNANKKEVLNYFDNLKVRGYARAGNIATETFEVPEGLLDQFTHALEPHLRKLGLPTQLKRGIPALIKPYKVCEKGDILNSDQARLLKLFDRKTSYFRLIMEYIWSAGGFFDDLGRAKDFPVVVSKSKKKQKQKQIPVPTDPNSDVEADEGNTSNEELIEEE